MLIEFRFTGSIHHSVDIEAGSELSSMLAKLERLLTQVLKQGAHMSQQLDDLVAKVTALETVEESAVALLQTLKSELDAAIAAGDTAGLQALSDRIGVDTQKLADAVAANTPAAPTSPDVPPVP